MEKMLDSQIGEIITKDPDLGFAFYQLGIMFPSIEDKKVSHICENHNLDKDWFLKHIDDLKSFDPVDWKENPQFRMSSMILHLKQVHRFFIQEKLPFLLKLIKGIEPKKFVDPNIGKDLKLLFPLFYDDFVGHIKKEESEVFDYVLFLNDLEKGKGNPGLIHFLKPEQSINQIALEHLEEDDEMEGIRALTSDFYCPDDCSVSEKVIFWELKRFEKDLRKHSRIENDHFFPKAVGLERSVREMIGSNLLKN